MDSSASPLEAQRGSKWSRIVIPYETHKWAADIKIIHFKPPEEVDGNVIIVLQPRKHSTEDKTVGFRFLKCSSTIIAQMAAAAGPWWSADRNGAGLPVWLRPCCCPAAVSARWCKGVLVPRPFLVSAVINASICLPETCAPSLILPILKSNHVGFWRSPALGLNWEEHFSLSSRGLLHVSFRAR